jgi:hypothetical protein
VVAFGRAEHVGTGLPGLRRLKNIFEFLQFQQLAAIEAVARSCAAKILNQSDFPCFFSA